MNTVRPMLATPGALPTGPGWGYELRWDGLRVQVDIDPDGMSVTDAAGKDLVAAFPELAPMAGLQPDVLLDGELVVIVHGRPSPPALVARATAELPAEVARLAERTPATFLAFDVLRLYGVDLTARPYVERRATLDRLGLDGAAWTVPPYFDDGPATVRAAEENGLDGVVAKRLAAPYRSGVPTGDWVVVGSGT